MRKVTKAQASEVLAELQLFADLHECSEYPTLRDHHHEELTPGAWSIDLEGGPEGLAYNFVTRIPGIYVEAINHCIIGIYAA